MKSAIWISRGPETTAFRRELFRQGYVIRDSLRVKSPAKAAYPKSLDLFVREVVR